MSIITKLVLMKKPLLLHVYNKQNLNAVFYNATQSAYKKLVLPSLLPWQILTCINQVKSYVAKSTQIYYCSIY